jgi:hypothetical protein
VLIIKIKFGQSWILEYMCFPLRGRFVQLVSWTCVEIIPEPSVVLTKKVIIYDEIVTVMLLLGVVSIEPFYFGRLRVTWCSCSSILAGVDRNHRYRFCFIYTWVAKSWSSACRRMLPDYTQHYRSHLQSLAWTLKYMPPNNLLAQQILYLLT